jgi:hypothetical protein
MVDIHKKKIRLLKHPTGFCSMHYWIEHEKFMGLPPLFQHAALIVIRRNPIDQMLLDYPHYKTYSDFHNGIINFLKISKEHNECIKKAECDVIEVDMHDFKDEEMYEQLGNAIGAKLYIKEKFESNPPKYIPVKHYNDYHLTVCKPTIAPIGNMDFANIIYKCFEESKFKHSNSLNYEISELSSLLTNKKVNKHLKLVHIENIKRVAEDMIKYEAICTDVTEEIFKAWLKYTVNIKRLMFICVIPKVSDIYKKPYKFLSQSSHLWIGEDEFPDIASEKIKEFIQYPVDTSPLFDYFYESENYYL